MKNYFLAVKKTDEDDCRVFRSQKKAEEYVAAHDDYRYEARYGEAIQYYKHNSIKFTVLIPTGSLVDAIIDKFIIEDCYDVDDSKNPIVIYTYPSDGIKENLFYVLDSK